MKFKSTLIAICILFSAILIAGAQNISGKKNDLFVKLNPVAVSLLGTHANPDFALGYKRTMTNINLRTYAWYRGQPYTIDYIMYPGLQKEIGLRAGVEHMTKWPRKLKLYYGIDLGASNSFTKSSAWLYDIGPSYSVYQTSNVHHLNAISSVFVGLQYNISERFYTRLEFAPEFSYYRPIEEISQVREINYKNPSPPPYEEPVVLYSEQYLYANDFALNVHLFNLWLGFKF